MFSLVKMKCYFSLKDIIVYYKNNVNIGLKYIEFIYTNGEIFT